MSSAPISEEDLLAFIDGELDAATSEAISTHLANFPEDAALVRDWRHQNDLVRASFARVEHEPVPLSLSLQSPRNPRTKGFLRLVPTIKDASAPAKNGARVELVKLALAALLAFGGGIGSALLTPHVANRITSFFHGATSPATELSAALQAMERAFLTADSPDSKSVGTSSLRISADELLALGLTIKGFEAGSIAQKRVPCLLLGKAGQALALCLDDTSGSAMHQPPDFKAAPAAQTASASGINSVTWAENGTRLALAGRLPASEILDLARQISKRGDPVAAAPLL